MSVESPSRDKQALDRLGARIVELLRSAGGSVEVVPNDRGGDHLLARFPGPAGRRPALVLGHFDTVWPSGTLEKMPFRAEHGRAFGPGIYDMKAGLAIFLRCMENSHSAPAPRPVWALFTSDEEIGSPTSRGLIEDLARQCAYVLVLEPPLADGSLKTARKGVGRFRLDVEGKAAHAGVAPQEGRSAIVELAHQVVRIQELQDLDAGTTLNVGVIQGGTTTNVVPAEASADIDVRVATLAEAERVERPSARSSRSRAGTRLAVSGGFNRPPMERSPAIAALFEQARQIGRSIGLELTEGSTGGGSDGNFTAALGIPTLDGLGARGGGAHADDEHILIDSLPERRPAGRAPARAGGRTMTMAPDPDALKVDEITIRRAETVADYRACQDAQRRAWGIGEDGYLIPVATMVGANLHGGLVLGAFLPDGQAVAMSFAFLGRIEGRLCLYSQLTGVVPGYQSQGLGYRIKMHQRDFAQAEGIGLIAWAFDPLQAGNAHFNLARLGATAGRYVENMYGERTDALNAGVPTDRLIAEWDTGKESNPGIRPDVATVLPRLINTTAEQGGASGPDAAPTGGMSVQHFDDRPSLLIEIPADIARLRRDRPELAERWRLAVREAFQAAFAAGYRAISFVRDETVTPRRVFYVLDRRPAP